MGSLFRSILFNVEQSLLSASLPTSQIDRKGCGLAAIIILEKEVVQWVLNRLEKWADIDLMKVNNSKCKVLHPAWNNPTQHYMLGDGCVENSFAE